LLNVHHGGGHPLAVGAKMQETKKEIDQIVEEGFNKILLVKWLK